MIYPVIKIISGLALVVVLVSPLAHLFGLLSLAAVKTSLLACTIAWFATAPWWLRDRAH
jgi:hypothetical protein